MRKHIVFAVSAYLLSFQFSCTTHTGHDGATVLFEEGASGWKAYGGGTWTFHEGTLTGKVSDTASFVMTDISYKDFDLTLEFHPDKTINSGVFVRCKEYKISFTDCYEMNIWDSRPDPKYRTGAVVMVSEPLEHINTVDKWNTMRIRCEGDHLQIWVNDILTTDTQNGELQEGYIALQASGSGEISFKNLNITAL